MLAGLPRASDAVSDAGGITLVRRLRALVRQAAIRRSSVSGLQRPGGSVNVCGTVEPGGHRAAMVAHWAHDRQGVVPRPPGVPISPGPALCFPEFMTRRSPAPPHRRTGINRSRTCDSSRTADGQDLVRGERTWGFWTSGREPGQRADSRCSRHQLDQLRHCRIRARMPLGPRTWGMNSALTRSTSLFCSGPGGPRRQRLIVAGPALLLAVTLGAHRQQVRATNLPTRPGTRTPRAWKLASDLGFG
jgi:hypothetical protein